MSADQDALRVQLGAILADEDPSIFDLLTSMATANPAEPDDEILARYVIGRLTAQGWQITRQDNDPGLCERCSTVSPAVQS